MGCCSGKQDGFGKELLHAHNQLRASHNSPPLKWSVLAAAKAEEWARHLAETGTLQRGYHEGLGQNLAYKMGTDLTGTETANLWYQEHLQYDFDNPSYKSSAGQFTQMIWAATTHIGGARVTRNNRCYVVANYSPPGNATNKGQFGKNVRPTLVK